MNQPLAYVHPGAKIAKNVVIEPFTTINNNVIIGEGTWIGSNVTIMEGARIGKNCNIFPGSVISGNPQDLKYDNEDTIVQIGNNVTIRECVTIHRGTNDKLATKIGSHCLLMTYVHIAHDCTIGDHVILASYTGLSGHVQIDDYAILEGKVAAQQFTHIGKHTFIGGASLIRKNIPPYVKAAREPLTFAGVNSVGLRRRGFSEETVRQIEDLYRILYIQNSNISKGIQAIKEQIPESDIRNEIIDFIDAADKGVIRGMI